MSYYINGDPRKIFTGMLLGFHLQMFWHYLIISFRRFYNHRVKYLVRIGLLTAGYTFLFYGLFVFNTYESVAALLIFTAFVVFVAENINGACLSCSKNKEFSIRKLFGANFQDIYIGMVVEMLLLSVSSALLSLMILDFNLLRNVGARPSEQHITGTDLWIIAAVIIIISMLAALLPGYKLSKAKLDRRLGA